MESNKIESDMKTTQKNYQTAFSGGSKDGGRDAPRSKFFHFQAVFGKKIAK